jgi:glycine/D-amino acid oxidase-like deaminating enzyme/nitrite reductase/ring-hydroxylating ferredoxin subunit
MDMLSVWRGTAPPSGFGMLQGDVQAEVLIVGGGITGVTCALLLAQLGHDVVLLEGDTIGSGATGNSTGNLYQTVAQGMAGLLSRWDAGVARQVVTERGAAMEFIERHANGPGVEFRKCPLVLYAQSAAEQDSIEQEFDALTQAGVQVERRREVPPPLPRAIGDVLVLPNQAQFNPAAYAQHLAHLAVQAGARIFEHSRVLELDDQARRAVTATGTVQAREVVMATHTPKGVRLVHAQMPVNREYGVAWRYNGEDPGPGIYWSRGDERLSVRTLDSQGQRYLVCVGQEHKTGHHNGRASLMALETLARKHLGVQGEPSHRWSAQNYRGADGLPYIGRDTSGCYVATGFATDGLTWGTVAARLIAHQIAGHDTAFAELCKPTRLPLVKGARNILQEVGTMTKSLVQDYLTHRQEEHLSRLGAGDSAILEQDGESVAAWRSPQGELYAVSPVCTHMGCKVHWNSAETSWDCACHGSRFRPDGTVIEGPALAPLARKHVREIDS